MIYFFCMFKRFKEWIEIKEKIDANNNHQLPL